MGLEENPVSLAAHITRSHALESLMNREHAGLQHPRTPADWWPRCALKSDMHSLQMRWGRALQPVRKTAYGKNRCYQSRKSSFGFHIKDKIIVLLLPMDLLWIQPNKAGEYLRRTTASVLSPVLSLCDLVIFP